MTACNGHPVEQHGPFCTEASLEWTEPINRTLPPRCMKAADQSRARHEVVLEVLGIDPALDRVAIHADLFLEYLQRLAGGNLDLALDEIEPRHHFRHRVLDLDSGVHFHEIELAALFVQNELDGAGAGIANVLTQDMTILTKAFEYLIMRYLFTEVHRLNNPFSSPSYAAVPHG